MHRPTRLGKKILIVEGPAGSGKSYIANHLAAQCDIPRIASSLGQRSFENPARPALQSAVNDYGKIVEALALEEEVVIIERLVVSQMVYGALRNPDLPHNQQVMGFTSSTGPMLSIQRLIDLARYELTWRWYPIAVPDEAIRISWLFVIPSVEQIEAQRLEAGKEYPWPAKFERVLYDSIARDLSGEAHDVLIYKNSPEQLTRLVKNIKAWKVGTLNLSLYESWKENWNAPSTE